MAEAETGVMGDRVTEVAEKKVPWAAKRRHGTLPGSTQCPTSHPGAPPAARASRQSALWMTRDAPPSQEEATAAKVEVAEAEVDGTRTKDGAGRAGAGAGAEGAASAAGAAAAVHRGGASRNQNSQFLASTRRKLSPHPRRRTRHRRRNGTDLSTGTSVVVVPRVVAVEATVGGETEVVARVAEARVVVVVVRVVVVAAAAAAVARRVGATLEGEVASKAAASKCPSTGRRSGR